MGALSSMVDAAVPFYWEILSQNTIAPKGQLHFRRIPAEIVCEDCNHRYRPEQDPFTCPACGGVRVKLGSGEELSLEAMEG